LDLKKAKTMTEKEGTVTEKKKKTHLAFWAVVTAVLALSLGFFAYAQHRIAKEQERQDLIADEFVYVVDQETGRTRLVPRHADWKERIQEINTRYGR
jgi:uncharacterized protein HemX